MLPYTGDYIEQVRQVALVRDRYINESSYIVSHLKDMTSKQ